MWGRKQPRMQWTHCEHCITLHLEISLTHLQLRVLQNFQIFCHWFCSKAHWGHPLQGYDAHVERYRTAAGFVSPCAKCEVILKDFAPLQLATLQCSNLLIPAWLTCKSLQFFVPCLLIGARSCGCGYFKIPYHAVEEQPGDVQPGRTGRLRWVEVKQTALHGWDWLILFGTFSRIAKTHLESCALIAFAWQHVETWLDMTTSNESGCPACVKLRCRTCADRWFYKMVCLWAFQLPRHLDPTFLFVPNMFFLCWWQSYVGLKAMYIYIYNLLIYIYNLYKPYTCVSTWALRELQTKVL